MPKAETMIDLINLLIEKNMIFAGNMISCHSGEGTFCKQFI